MSASTALPTELLDILIDQGKELPSLLREAKTQFVEAGQDIPGKVKISVTNILSSIRKSPVKGGFTKVSVEKLAEKIEEFLAEFIKHDSENKSVYEGLKKEVVDLCYRKQAESTPTAPSLHSGDSSNADSFADLESLDELEFQSATEMLSAMEQRWLECFLLFPAEAEIKKREIIHCWLGMDLTDSSLGESLLAKFVASGLIERKIQNKKLLNRYKMPGSVRSRLLLDQETKIKREGSWSILLKNETPMKTSILRTMTMVTSQQDDDVDLDPEALLNINQGTLNATQFKTMSGMQKLKVLHLGNWQQDSQKYIVVEDVDAFKNIRGWWDLRFLSLGGVSGMMKLPDFVCELYRLEVLDLRGCSHLEEVPGEIGGLRRITHLDLSGCYLLDHVPMEILYLECLDVLKGFIINDHQYLESYGKGKKKGKGVNRATATSPCMFEELSKLKLLRKLTIITRRMDFPTRQDFQTLRELKWLASLRITWVNSFTMIDETNRDDGLGSFPATLMKLELRAAPEHIASRLLRSISEDRKNCVLDKLYITGGGLREMKHSLAQPTAVRLRYLPQFQMHWDDFMKVFRNLDRLEIEGCPELIDFPCDGNGVWELGC